MESWVRALPFILLGIVAAWLLFGAVMWLFSRSRDRSRVYDKVSHYSHAVKQSDQSRLYVPFGFVLGWLVESKLITSEVASYAPGQTSRFRKGEISSSELYREVDGVLTSDMVKPEVQAFLSDYLPKRYSVEYETLFGPRTFTDRILEDDRSSYEQVKDLLTRRYSEWREKQTPN